MTLTNPEPYCLVGIDPGTTAGLCIISLQRNILFLQSKKEFSPANMVSCIEKIGTPLAICTDKAKIPSNVEKVALAFRTKMIMPQQDMSVEEKIALSRPYKTNNSHERDALACVLYGLSSMQPFINKVRHFANEQNASALFEKLIHKLLKTPQSFSKALSELTLLPKEVEEIHKEQTPPSLKNAQTKLRLLAQEVMDRQRKIEYLEYERAKVKPKIIEKRVNESVVLKHRDERIRMLEKELVLVKKHMLSQQQCIRQLEWDILTKDGFIWMPMIPHVSTKQVAQLPKKHWQCIYVKHAIPFQPDAFEELKKWATVIVSSEKMPHKVVGMLWLVTPLSWILVKQRIIGIPKNKFYGLKQKANALGAIVQEYHQERALEWRQIDSGKSL